MPATLLVYDYLARYLCSHWGQDVVSGPGTSQTHCKEMDNVLTIYPPGTPQLHSEFSWSILLQFPSSGNFQYILNVPDQCFFQENLQDIQNVPNQCSHSVLAQRTQSFSFSVPAGALTVYLGGKTSSTL